MKKVTAAGRNVEEAVQSGLQELQLTKDQVEITVVQEEYKGFLGIFGKKNAIVELKEKKIPFRKRKRIWKKSSIPLPGLPRLSRRKTKKQFVFILRVKKRRCSLVREDKHSMPWKH